MATRYTGYEWMTMINSTYGDSEIIRYRRVTTPEGEGITIFTVGGDESDGQVLGTLGNERERVARNIAHNNAQPNKTYTEWVNESLHNIYGGDTREIPM